MVPITTYYVFFWSCAWQWRDLTRNMQVWQRKLCPRNRILLRPRYIAKSPVSRIDSAGNLSAFTAAASHDDTKVRHLISWKQPKCNGIADLIANVIPMSLVIGVLATGDSMADINSNTVRGMTLSTICLGRKSFVFSFFMSKLTCHWKWKVWLIALYCPKIGI